MTTEQLTSAIAAAASRTQLVQEYRGTVANAVYGLDQSLRNLLQSLRPNTPSSNNVVSSKHQQNHHHSYHHPSHQQPQSNIKQTSLKKRTAAQKQQRKQQKKQQRKRRRTTRRGIISDHESFASSSDSEVAANYKNSNNNESVVIAGSPRKKNSISEELPEIACICRKPPYGEMLGCDNPECTIEWFHLGCVGLEQPPSANTWLCPQCSTSSK